tara:strand:- start:156 stop:602 length:447 start_codon:yes stop_codon:yes gene_type:complete
MQSINVNIRPSKPLLSWLVDQNKQYVDLPEFWLKEACGIIPDLFESAINRVGGNGGMDEIAKAMTEEYGMGGFTNSWQKVNANSGTSSWQEVNANGTLTWEADGPIVHPYVTLMSLDSAQCDVECLIYPYEIVGLRDSNGNSIVGRFD